MLRHSSGVNMKSLKKIRGNFVVFCLKNHQPKYRSEVSHLPHEVVFADTLETLVREITDVPPSAVLMDQAAESQAGKDLLAPFYRLAMRWPVLKSAVAKNDSIQVTALDGIKAAPVAQAFDGITKADPAWVNPSLIRCYLRQEVPCRARIMGKKDGDWVLGNIRNLSMGGSFVATINPPEPGKIVLLEIWDLGERPLRCKTKASWVRLWEDSVQLPGVGLSFGHGLMGLKFKETLLDFLTRSFLRNNLKMK